MTLIFIANCSSNWKTLHIVVVPQSDESHLESTTKHNIVCYVDCLCCVLSHCLSWAETVATLFLSFTLCILCFSFSQNVLHDYGVLLWCFCFLLRLDISFHCHHMQESLTHSLCSKSFVKLRSALCADRQVPFTPTLAFFWTFSGSIKRGGNTLVPFVDSSIKMFNIKKKKKIKCII